jgi:hypothetical protein
MAHEEPAIDLSKDTAPDLAQLAEEVHRTRRPRVIRRDTEELAVLMPAAPWHTQPRGKPFTLADGLWALVGSGHTAQPTDIARHKDDYLAEASLSETHQQG